MENETENPNSSNGENVDNLDELDTAALKELLLKDREALSETQSKNRQLFERAKKAEGFEQDADGNWIKTEVKKEKKEKKPEAEPKPSEEFGLVEKTFLKSSGYNDPDEWELAQKLMKETGKDLDVLIETNYFKSEVKDLQDKKATEKATTGIRGGRGSSKATETPEHWIAKGTPPTKEQVPDRKTRAKIARAMMASTKSGKKFYND